MNPAVSSTPDREGTAPSLDTALNLNPRLVARRIGVSRLAGTLAPFRPVAVDPRVRLAETIMYHNPSRTLSLNGLARRTGVSISRLCHQRRADARRWPSSF